MTGTGTGGSAGPAVPEFLRSPAGRAVVGSGLVRDWDVQDLGAGQGANPVTRGVWRVSGRATDDAGHDPGWSVVVKAVGPPPPRRGLDMGTSPTSWNYWQREVLLHESGRLDALPAGVRGPRCYGVQREPDGASLWLEDVPGIGDLADGSDDQVLVARALGRLAGRSMDHGRTEEVEWLSGGLLRDWCLIVPRLAPDFFGEEAPGWRTPEVLAHLPSGPQSDLAQILARRHEVLASLDLLPLAFAHNDADPENTALVPREDGGRDVVLIDWALAGPAPVGGDLGTLLLAVAEQRPHATPQGLDDLTEVLLGAFVEGVLDAGHQLDVGTARRGAIGTLVLRYGLYAAVVLSERSASAARGGRRLPLLEHWAAEAATWLLS